MISWAENLYIQPGLERKRGKIIQKINRGSLLVSAHVVTLASNPDNLLEYYKAAYLKQNSLFNSDIKIVGLASDEGNAQDLVLKIIDDIYRETGGFDVRSHFKFKETKKEE